VHTNSKHTASKGSKHKCNQWNTKRKHNTQHATNGSKCGKRSDIGIYTRSR
jgi:hypothetical protein